MKRVFLSLAIVAIAFGAQAQKSSSAETGFKLAIGPRVGIVVGDYDQVFGLVIGGELQGEYKISNDASITIASGYTNYSGKHNLGSTGFVPVLAGARYYPSAKVFIGGRLGASFNTESGGGTWFTYEPQIGLNSEKFQVALGYNGASKSSVTLANIGLTAVYKLN